MSSRVPLAGENAEAGCMTTVVKAATAKDFLALVPQLVGFPPVDSVVFVAFRGNRTCGAMRFDLPAENEYRAHAPIATTLVGTLSKIPGVDAVVPVVYTDESFAATPGVPPARFVRTVVARFEFSGFVVRDALCVAADGWGSYFDDKCPPGGRPLAKITASSVGDAIPVDERHPLGDLDEWARLPEVDAGTRKAVALRLCALEDAYCAVEDETLAGPDGHAERNAQDGDDQPPTHVRLDADDDLWQLVDLPAMIETALALDPVALDDRSAALIIFVVRSPALRDVVMMQWAFDRQTGEQVLDDADRFAAGEPVELLDTSVLMLGEGPRPDTRRVETALVLLKAIVARTPLDDRPPLLCMLGWLSWAIGRSSVAHRFVDAARRINDRYGLVEVLAAMLDRGHLPEWAFAIPEDPPTVRPPTGV